MRRQGREGRGRGRGGNEKKRHVPTITDTSFVMYSYSKLRKD